MNDHEDSGKILKDVVENSRTEGFDSLTLDIAEIRKQSSDPFFTSMLLYKLAKEREETNRLLGQLNEKYDRIMFELKTSKIDKAEYFPARETDFRVLPDQDQVILKFIDERGSGTARGVQAIMHYKGLNAASQRLNKLYKEGYLKKVQSGKQVLYLVKN